MGSSSNDAATNAATAQANQRNSQIQGAVTAIQNAYNSPSRQNQVADYQNTLQKYYTNQVNQQESQNARNLTFAEARSGLAGGSANGDANTQLQKDYSQGLLQATQAAQAGGANLKQSDQNAKNQMISLAQAGNMTGNVAQQVSQAQNTALGSAQNFANANSLGSLFQGTQNIYQNEQTAAANRNAQNNPFGSPYNQSSPYGGG